MFQDIKAKDIVTLIVLIVITMIGGYYYVRADARAKIWLSTYPIRADLSVRQETCSAGSPSWMADIIRNQALHNNAPSNQIAYIDKTGKLYHCENGYQGEYPLISSPVTVDSRFRYASVTKLWTADAILALVKEGRLTLDTKLASVLTEINNPRDPRVNDITIGQLLLHRAGFDRTSVFGNDMFGIGEQICPNNLDRLNNINLSFTPNEKMSYSNLGYCLLGEVIARVNNEPYSEVMAKQYDFDTQSLSFVGNEQKPDEVFYNYVETGLTGVGDIFTAFDYNTLASSAGLSGNAVDLAQQVRTMIQTDEPNITSLDAQIACDKSILRDCQGYAMYAYQSSPSAPTVYYRDGVLLGLSSLVAVDDSGEVVALLSNGMPDNAKEKNDRVKMDIYGYLSGDK